MHQYEVNLNWTEGRKGSLESPVLEQHLAVATPPEFPGGVAGIWSPEHLFVSAISSCLMTTFLAVAENSKLSFKRFSCHALGTLDKVDGKFMMTEVLLRPTLVIEEAEQVDRAKRLLEKSESACLISNSVKSTIVFEPTIVVEN